MIPALGLDFGTTNTVLASVCADGTATPVAFPVDDRVVEALRTALCFWRHGTNPDLSVEAGPHAIKQFIDHPGECRFIQSFKTFAASPHFQGTYLYGKRYQFEDLLAAFFARIRSYASSQLTTLPKRLVVGRPVAFAGASPDPALALRRYDQALCRFDFEEILKAMDRNGRKSTEMD